MNNRLIKNRESGVTIIELVVVIGIFFILMGIAVPNFLVWQSNYRFTKAVRDLYYGFQRARLAAIREHSICTIVFNQPVDGITYDYVVYLDDPNDPGSSASIGCMEYEDGERILAKVKLSDYKNVAFGQNENGNSVTFPNNNDDPPKKAVAFQPNGLPRTNTGALPIGSVYLKNTNNGVVRQVILAQAGRVRISN